MVRGSVVGLMVGLMMVWVVVGLVVVWLMMGLVEEWLMRLVVRVVVNVGLVNGGMVDMVTMVG